MNAMLTLSIGVLTWCDAILYTPHIARILMGDLFIAASAVNVKKGMGILSR